MIETDSQLYLNVAFVFALVVECINNGANKRMRTRWGCRTNVRTDATVYCFLIFLASTILLFGCNSCVVYQCKLAVGKLNIKVEGLEGVLASKDMELEAAQTRAASDLQQLRAHHEKELELIAQRVKHN